MIRRIAFTVLAALLSTQADALLFRAYLASDGNDANPCTLQQPCRLLPAALAVVRDAGEIWMLDSANYNTGPVTINVSVTILAVPGVVGSLVAAGGPALSAANKVLNVRNLVVVPAPDSPPGDMGILATGVTQLTVEGCTFANLSGDGVRVQGLGRARIVDSTFRNVYGTAIAAVAGATIDVQGSKVMGNYDVSGGVYANATGFDYTAITVSDSILTGLMTGANAYASVAGGGVARIAITRSTVSNSQHGMHVNNANGAPAEISISQSLVFGNVYPYYQAGSAMVYTLVNNHFFNNYSSGFGTLTAASPM
jgi:hypothetical protein